MIVEGGIPWDWQASQHPAARPDAPCRRSPFLSFARTAQISMPPPPVNGDGAEANATARSHAGPAIEAAVGRGSLAGPMAMSAVRTFPFSWQTVEAPPPSYARAARGATLMTLLLVLIVASSSLAWTLQSPYARRRATVMAKLFVRLWPALSLPLYFFSGEKRILYTPCPYSILFLLCLRRAVSMSVRAMEKGFESPVGFASSMDRSALAPSPLSIPTNRNFLL